MHKLKKKVFVRLCVVSFAQIFENEKFRCLEYHANGGDIIF